MPPTPRLYSELSQKAIYAGGQIARSLSTSIVLTFFPERFAPG